MKLDEQDYLAHYGILRKSGRYPWGSGGTTLKRSRTFLDVVNDMEKQGMKAKEIAKAFHTDEFPFTTHNLRAMRSIANNEIKQAEINQAKRLRDRGWSHVKIGERMGLNESSVRRLLDPDVQRKADILQTTASMLQKEADKKTFLDVGAGVEHHLGITSTQLGTALAVLQEKGYKIHPVNIRQVSTGENTKARVLTPPGYTQKDAWMHRNELKTLDYHTQDRGESWEPPKEPLNISSKRIKIAYKEDGGATKDGLIEIRPGAKDLDLGKSRYAQIRVAVDGTHFLKGMAVYNPDLPVGTDIRYNTNKTKVGNTKHDVMKPQEKDVLTGKIDKLNPFGATIQKGGQRGALNILNQEGDWDNWKSGRELATQMLSKQPPKLASTQLDVMYDRQRRELASIKALSNPAVRKKLLEEFSDSIDSHAVDMEAAARPRQSSKVLIPINEVKPHEVYAPGYRDGERLALVRYPHGGTFEIPELTVNNRTPAARKILGTSPVDAIGIHHKTAEKLSGADFDGDAVVAIPNNRGEVKARPSLQGLKDFDPKGSFPPYDGMKTIDGGRYNTKTREVEYGPKGKQQATMQHKMGDVSNLITDMTLRGAPDEHIAAAVRHSMVIIDAEKHHLDHKQSYEVNGITNLKRQYQFEPTGGATRGASTLISKATQETHLPKRKPRPAKEGGPIDRATGKKVFVPTGETFRDRKGRTQLKTFETKRLAVTDDAHTLSTGIRIESLYADHSNRLKAMANEARKEMVNTKTRKVNDSAKVVYKKELDSLTANLKIAQRNAPLERQAQVLANHIIAQKREANPKLSPEQLKKVQRNALKEARYRTTAGKQRVPISDKEWEAIQAGAISNNKLEQILRHADPDVVRKHATPKEQLKMTSSKSALAKSMLARGYTQAEVADKLGVAVSTLKLSLAEG